MINTRLLIVFGALVVLIDAGVLIYRFLERRTRRPSVVNNPDPTNYGAPPAKAASRS
jgi:hypothetical protein